MKPILPRNTADEKKTRMAVYNGVIPDQKKGLAMAITDDEFPARLRTKLKHKGYTDIQAHEITQSVAESLAEDSKLMAMVERQRMDKGK